MQTATVSTQGEKKSNLYYYTGAFMVAFAIILFLLIFTLELFYGRAPNVYAVVFCVVTITTFVWVFISTRRLLRHDQAAQAEYYNVGILRMVTSSVMLGYAFTKLSNGHMYLSYYALDTRLDELSDFDTVWSFYGRYSSMQALLGIMELVPSLMLLFRRSACLGALIMLPVAGNVVLLNIYYRIGGLTLPVSFLVLVFSLYIVYGYKSTILQFLRSLRDKSPAPLKLSNSRRRLFSILKFLPLGFILLIALLRLINHSDKEVLKGAYELSEFKMNGRMVNKDSLPRDAYRKIYFEKRQLQSAVLNAEGFMRVAIQFRHHDSLSIAYRNGPLDSYVLPETEGRFDGTYKTLATGEIMLSGLQEKQRIEAKYKRLPLREFDYWWE